MKIALPTNDGVTISEHFGRSASFLIFEIENGQIKSRELKTNGMEHSHAQGACDHHSAESKPHSHLPLAARGLRLSAARVSAGGISVCWRGATWDEGSVEPAGGEGAGLASD